jgi:hypothetical protein
MVKEPPVNASALIARFVPLEETAAGYAKWCKNAPVGKVFHGNSAQDATFSNGNSKKTVTLSAVTQLSVKQVREYGYQ